MSQKGMKEPYDWDEYADMFLPRAEELALEAVRAEYQEKVVHGVGALPVGH